MLEKLPPITLTDLPYSATLRYAPPATDRARWDALPRPWRDRLVRQGMRWLGRAWPTLPARRYLDFFRDGNRSRYEHVYFMRRTALGDLVLAECAEGQGRFVADAADLAWAICEETSWVVPAHNNHDSPAARGLPPWDGDLYVDLFCAETSATLSLSQALLADALDRENPAFRERIRDEIERRAHLPFLAHENWGWMGLSHGGKVNNWNPWICSNLLVSTLLTSSDGPQRLALVQKLLRCLERFCAGYDPDGGCDEGPGYWNAAGASLFDALDFLDGESGGKLRLWSDPLLRAMGRFPMLMHLGSDQFVNFADGQRRGNPDGALLARFGRLVGDADLEQFGRWALGLRDGYPVTWNWGHFQRNLGNLFRLEPAPAVSEPPLVRDGLLPDLQVLVSREKKGSVDGFAMAIKGGHNGESHNHNDVGSFILYLDGKPLMVDAGVGEYTKKTFSHERYTIWTMQSAWHNLPQVGGVDQAAGGQYRTRSFQIEADEGKSSAVMDLAGAWPAEAGLRAWTRRMTLSRAADASVTLEDAWELEKPRAVRLHFLSLAKPQVLEGSIRYELGGQSVAFMSCDAAALEATIEEKTIDDGSLRASWGPSLWRLCLRVRHEAATGSCRFSFRRGA